VLGTRTGIETTIALLGPTLRRMAGR
jgi:hypothetical protein